MNELAKRSFAAAVLVAIALLAAVRGGYFFAALVGIAACVMLFEWRRIVARWNPLWQVAGFFYALLPAMSLLWIRDRAFADLRPIGLELLVWVFITTWAVDIGAYFAGRTFGGPKLAPAISPNKTGSGLVGGILSSTLLAGAWVSITSLPPTLFLLAPLFAAAAQGGDLFESWMKRRAGVKDSGTWLPGHGGALDRLDGRVVVATLTAAALLGRLI